MRYQVSFEGQAVPREAGGRPFDADRLEAHLERLMEELVLRRVEEASVAGTIAKGQVEVSVLVEAPDLESALERGQAVVRTAIEEAAGSASERLFDWTSVRAQRVGSLARATG